MVSGQVSFYGWDCPAAVTAFLRLLLSVRGLAQLDINWASQPHHLHCYTVMQPEAGNDSYSVVMAVSCNGPGRGMHSGGNQRGQLGRRTASAAPSNSSWQRESEPLAMPPALLSQYRKDTAAVFVTRIVFVFHYKFLMERRQGCFHNSWAKPLQSSAILHLTWFI